MSKHTTNISATAAYLNEAFGIDFGLLALAEESERAAHGRFDALDDLCTFNQYKVLNAFRKNRISETHFNWATGYGYDDAGREATERVYADIFGTEAAIVRTQIVNGTHALSVTLSGILRPGDELIYCTGTPYDTLLATIGINTSDADAPAGRTGSDAPGASAGRTGSLAEFGITYKQVELTADGGIDLAELKSAITPKTRMVCLQRATGYADRKAITLDEIAEWADFLEELNPNIVRMVDNCYGEFLDHIEPTQAGAGAHIIAGSLIKNPGGGLALSGGYVAGRADLVEMISYRLTCPGIGGECGLTFGQTRTMLQGLFLAPKVVNGAVKGAILCAHLFESLGYKVSPAWDEDRSDIIETVTLGTPEGLIAFCEGVQAAAPVDSFVRPEPWDMPGYEDKVIMAAGAFIQGSSIELSADGPLREPYNAYFQGGLTYEYSKIGVLMAAQKLLDKGLLSL
jgi:cystathionine beta-lyase family protein involved in aluminum resistance